jgi:hypothetical protein
MEPSGLPIRKQNLLGNEVNLRQIFLDPIRPKTLKNITMIEKKRTIPELGCTFFDRRRRRKRQGFYEA